MRVADGDDIGSLLARVAEGDQEAFARFYDATARVVFGIVLRVVRDHAQAEEVAQEVYVHAWRTAARYNPGQGSAKAWLNTIAHHRAVDRVRAAQATVRRDQRHYRESDRSRSEVDISDVVVEHDEGRRVREALDNLPERQQAAVHLAYFDGLTHREVADLLDIPLGTAKSRIRDGIRHLRTCLEEG